MNGLQPFESTIIEQTTETISHKTVTAAVLTINRITSLRELLHHCINLGFVETEVTLPEGYQFQSA